MRPQFQYIGPTPIRRPQFAIHRPTAIGCSTTATPAVEGNQLLLSLLLINAILPKVLQHLIYLRLRSIMETSKLLIEKALSLKPQEKLMIIEVLIKSLDEPNKEIEHIWAEEAERRLNAYRTGKLKGVPYKDVFGEQI